MSTPCPSQFSGDITHRFRLTKGLRARKRLITQTASHRLSGCMEKLESKYQALATLRLHLRMVFWLGGYGMAIAVGMVPQAKQAILDALRNRRTCRSFTSEPVPRGVVDAMLEAATWAPNHRLTNPWRFFVVENGGPVRHKIAELVHEWTYQNVKNPNEERRVQSAEQAKQEVLIAPVMLYVFTVPGRDEEETTENYAATCCAVQNLQIAAHAHGVAVGWSTGKPAKPAALPSLLGADPSWRLVAALFSGYPAQELKQERKPVSEVTKWL
ncbi:MAG: hypothetical protein EXR57_01345 [Dehalococcoidia bacterium]|nr:hypothetical protein [Dehalococcoidia bacterium]MSQ34450.1 hypothetical protein [Dehalococcoidia bacterium]